MKNNRTFLEKLLDGTEVQYEKLSDVLPIKRGKRVVRNELDENGIYPVYQNSLQPLGYFNNKNCEAYTTFIIAAGAAGEIGFSEVEFWAADDCYYFECPKEVLNNKFLYYVLMSQKHNLLKKVRKASIPRLGKDTIEKLSIPIPPLSVQTEIVRILDTLTALTSELTSELTLRRKQYEYYREKLLSEEELGKVGFEWKTIDEISKKISSGGTPTTSNNGYYDNGTIPWLRTQEVDFKEIWDTNIKITEDGLNNSSAKWIPANCVIVAMYGATVGKTAINKIPLTTNQACANIEINDKLACYRYIFHYLTSKYEYIKSLGSGSQTNINAQIIKKLKVPVPPIEEQQRIVSILDKFETLTNSITDGLPLAIEQSQKRYEYYRELLLSF